MDKELNIFKLQQELCDNLNELQWVERALKLESNLYKRKLELDDNISHIKDDMNNFYHPRSEVK